ncbi:MAG: hypothetical protein JOY89_19915 [Solirubrobacterales bacterium]|nr:hypothetical protein [Solirubrobacterales bacterium]
MRRNTLLVDLAIALAVTILVLILVPGLAVLAILALAVLVVCGVSFAVTRWRRRGSRQASRRRTPAPR